MRSSQGILGLVAASAFTRVTNRLCSLMRLSSANSTILFTIRLASNLHPESSPTLPSLRNNAVTFLMHRRRNISVSPYSKAPLDLILHIRLQSLDPKFCGVMWRMLRGGGRTGGRESKAWRLNLRSRFLLSSACSWVSSFLVQQEQPEGFSLLLLAAIISNTFSTVISPTILPTTSLGPSTREHSPSIRCPSSIPPQFYTPISSLFYSRPQSRTPYSTTTGESRWR